MSYELLEHTADVGIRGTGDSCEEAFASVAEGLAALLGAWSPQEGDPRSVRLEAADRRALLAAWVDELLYIREARDAVFGGFDVAAVSERSLRATIRLAPAAGRALEGAAVKAATYHRLDVIEDPEEGWSAQVYLDV